MPKIVIREYDYTKAGRDAYANFSVVVPGFVSNSNPDQDPFDENGVFECNSRDKFEELIGLIGDPTAITLQEAAGPNVDSENGWPKTIKESDFESIIGEGKLYVVTEEAGTNGILHSTTHKYEKAILSNKNAYNFDDETPLTPNTNPDVESENGSYTITFNNGGLGERPTTLTGRSTIPTTLPVLAENGYRFDGWYSEASKKDPAVVGDELTGDITLYAGWTKLTTFASLLTIGNAEITATHYGNQIAWELLGLGYTVLYKKLTSIGELSTSDFWKPLKDKSLYDFRYLISGLLGNTSAINSEMLAVANFYNPENKAFDAIDPLAAGRGDCIALIDVEPSCYKNKANQKEAIEGVMQYAWTVPATKYAAIFAPTVTYAAVDNVTDFGNNTTFPASFHYLACAARSSEHFNEWYANAGYSRGVSKYTVASVGCRFGEAAVNVFQKRFADKENFINKAVNPIIMLRGNAYLWGNRTAYELGDDDLRASHFLNIRQLCTTIKKEVYMACRQFSYDPNSETLWTKFCNRLAPTLEKMKADQGIADYKFIKVASNRKAFLSAIVRIVPIEAVEDFDISIYLEDSLAGTIVNADETE